MAAEILIVDDSPVQAATRRAILKNCSRNIQTASSAEQALEILDRPEPIQSLRLLITDHHMPGMNGPEFVAMVRERTSDLPILVLSGLSGAETEYEGLNVIFRTKPFLPTELIALTHSLLCKPMSRTA